MSTSRLNSPASASRTAIAHSLGRSGSQGRGTVVCITVDVGAGGGGRESQMDLHRRRRRAVLNGSPQLIESTRSANTCRRSLARSSVRFTLAELGCRREFATTSFSETTKSAAGSYAAIHRCKASCSSGDIRSSIRRSPTRLSPQAALQGRGPEASVCIGLTCAEVRWCSQPVGGRMSNAV